MNGFLKASIYYLVGFALAGLAYWVFGWEYIHAPGAHHLIIFLTFVGGFIWFLRTLHRFYFGHWDKSVRQIMIVTLSMSVLFTAFILHLIYLPAEHEQPAQDKSLIEVAGDTTTLRRNGALIYYKVKDSVFFNSIDSSRIDWNQVEVIRK